MSINPEIAGRIQGGRFVPYPKQRARHGLNSLSVLTLRSKSAKVRPPAMRSQDPEGYAVPSARSVG
jgi:hypothetical protein